MEDVLKFLLVAAVLVVAFVRQVRKETQKKAARKPVVPAPEAPSPHPRREDEDSTYGGYIPEGPDPAPEPAPAPSPRPTLLSEAEGQRTTWSRQPRQPEETTAPQAEADDDFHIRSAEEARRAIVWGEILARKY